jgi:23S rRNA (pseudouridine1915-N3)-methyltransferase
LNIPVVSGNYFLFIMKIKIIAVGKVKDRAFREKIEEYTGRIQHDVRLENVEIKDSNREKEGRKILDHLRREQGHVIALDERGSLVPSAAFARMLSAIQQKIVFVIGGPDGLTDDVKKNARERLALSPLTFTHEIARLLLLEQLYRAVSIIKNRKYHRG